MKRIVGGLGKLIGLPLYFLRSVARLLWAGLMVVSGPLLRRVDASPRFKPRLLRCLHPLPQSAACHYRWHGAGCSVC